MSADTLVSMWKTFWFNVGVRTTEALTGWRLDTLQESVVDAVARQWAPAKNLALDTKD